MIENRRHVRAPLSQSVSVTLPSSPTETLARTANVSESGMWVVMTNPPPVGTIVRFAISLGESKIVHGYGHVVWVRFTSKNFDEPCGMGLEFRSLSNEDREAIASAVHEALVETGRTIDEVRAEQRIAS